MQFPPQYGVVLTVDGEVVTDEGIVIANGDGASAYAWSPETTQGFVDEDGKPYTRARTPGNEMIGSLSKVDIEQVDSGFRLTGTNDDGDQSTWLVEPSGRPCKGCF